MTENPNTPQPEGVQPSVVLDANATVKKSRLPMVLTTLVVLGLVAFTVVYFATRDEKAAYRPGPESAAIVQGLAVNGIEVAFTDDELPCIDDTFSGYDLSLLEVGYDPFDGGLDADAMARTGTMFEDCLQRASRQGLIAGSMAMEGFANDEQASCAAEGFDALVLDTGGYVVAMSSDAPDVSDEMFTIFSDCGIDLGFGDASADSSPCAAGLKTLQTAIEAYFATNGTDATSFDDLVPDFVRDDPSNEFEFVPGVDGSIPTVHGIGECEGYDG